MILSTRTLFRSILWNYQVDCLCDIGSRDGEESIATRNIIPKSEIIAFEANEINYNKMLKDSILKENKIKIYPYAISDNNGFAIFNVLDANDNQTLEIKGSSSLKYNPRYPAAKKTLVETKRLDDFITKNYPEFQTICLWIDVEGEEFEVIQGIKKIKNRILAIHVETAIKPLRIGQKTLKDLDRLCDSFGFKRVGKNFKDKQLFGDVVYISNVLLRNMRHRILVFIIKSWVTRLISISLPSFIKKSDIYSIIKIKLRS